MTLDELFAVYNEINPTNNTTSNKENNNVISFYSPLEQIDRVREVLKKDNLNNLENKEINTEKYSFKPIFLWNYTTPIKEITEEFTIPFIDKYKPIETSKNLIQYLKNKEKFSPTVYNDTGGVATIGYGFTDPEIIKLGTLTEEQATAILLKDIENRRNKLKSQIITWDLLNRNLLDALISYGFNVGVENWKKNQPKLLAALNEGRFKDASKYLNAVKDKKGNVLPGLVKRRKEEREWFDS